MDTWIHQKIRAASLRRVIAWGVSVGLWVLLAAGNARYIHNFVSGPFALGAAELDSIHDITTAPRYFARVSGSKVLDTGIGDYTGQYYALLVGDKYLIVEAKSPISNVVEGELASTPSDLAGLLYSKELGDLRHHLYPFYIGQESFREPGYFMILVLVVYGFLFARYAIPPWRHFRIRPPIRCRRGSDRGVMPWGSRWISSGSFETPNSRAGAAGERGTGTSFSRTYSDSMYIGCRTCSTHTRKSLSIVTTSSFPWERTTRRYSIGTKDRL